MNFHAFLAGICGLSAIGLGAWAVHEYRQPAAEPGELVIVDPRVDLGELEAGSEHRVAVRLRNDSPRPRRIVGSLGTNICRDHGCIEWKEELPLTVPPASERELHLTVQLRDPGDFRAPIVLYVDRDGGLQKLDLQIAATVRTRGN